MTDQFYALEVMNNARAEAPGGDRPALIWDDGLAQGAQDWANTMAETGNFKHSGADGLGENISAFFGDVSGGELQASAQGWVDEKPKYHGEKIGETGPDGGFEAWGHYTQVIWPNTTNVGMGQATASNGSIYVCGRFSPPGNWSGESATNGMDPNTNFTRANGHVPSSGGTYTVKSGDSMSSIAQKLGMCVHALEGLNPQVKGPAFQINVGQVITVK